MTDAIEWPDRITVNGVDFVPAAQVAAREAAAFQRGAEAMREACDKTAQSFGRYALASAIHDIPIPEDKQP